MENVNQEAIKQDESRSPHPWGMLIKIFVGWVLMVAIMCLSAGMSGNDGNFEHIGKDLYMVFSLSFLLWGLIFLSYDKLKLKASRLGLLVMACSLGFYAVLMFSPSALEHRDHALSYDVAKRILEDIYQKNGAGSETLSSTSVKDVVAKDWYWELLVERNQSLPKRANCTYIDNNMTIQELESYIKTFNPHCVDAEFGLK